jgi:hypothetical protein
MQVHTYPSETLLRELDVQNRMPVFLRESLLDDRPLPQKRALVDTLMSSPQKPISESNICNPNLKPKILQPRFGTRIGVRKGKPSRIHTQYGGKKGSF